jgi:hypothetical protein
MGHAGDCVLQLLSRGRAAVLKSSSNAAMDLLQRQQLLLFAAL